MSIPAGNRRHLPLLLAFTLILAAYLMVWLAHENGAAGLSFIGLEIGEWVKFLPQMQAGEILPGRDLFYLPPVTLGLMLVLFTAGWPQGRWQTRATRGLAVLVSLLAFPSLDAIRLEPSSEWLWRLLLVGLVVVAALLAGLLGRVPGRVRWLLMAVLGTAGGVLPTWAFFAIRPAAEEVLQSAVQPGLGVWLNMAGHLLVAMTAMRWVNEEEGVMG